MTARRDEVAAAILAQAETVDRVLYTLRIPYGASQDLKQEVLIAAWKAGRCGMVEWGTPAVLRAFLRVVAARAAYQWRAAQQRDCELHERAAVTAIDAERRYLGREMLAFLRGSTTPERWRVLRSYAVGVPVIEIARRERLPVPTVYNWIRLARRDLRAAIAREDAAIYIRRKK